MWHIYMATLGALKSCCDLGLGLWKNLKKLESGGSSLAKLHYSWPGDRDSGYSLPAAEFLPLPCPAPSLLPPGCRADTWGRSPTARPTAAEKGPARDFLKIVLPTERIFHRPGEK